MVVELILCLLQSHHRFSIYNSSVPLIAHMVQEAEQHHYFAALPLTNKLRGRPRG